MPKADVLIERNYLKALYVHVRCPGCLKLYRIDSRDLPQSYRENGSKGYWVEASSPTFDCQVCATTFTVALQPLIASTSERSFDKFSHFQGDRRVVAKVVQFGKDPQIKALKALPKDKDRIKACPKCKALNPLLVAECQSCGVLFGKIEYQQSAILGGQATPSLAKDWEAVLTHPQNSLGHQKFLEACEHQGAYDYALDRYEKLTELCGFRAVLPYSYQLYQGLKRDVSAVAWISNQVEKLYVWPYWGKIIKGIPLGFAAISILVGFLEPAIRNLVGIGVSVIFLWVALFVLSQARST